MKKKYLEPSLNYVQLKEDVVRTSGGQPVNLGDFDWGWEDDFE